MDIRDIQTTYKKEKDLSSKEKQKTITLLSQEDIKRIGQQEVKIYEADEMDYLT